MKPTPGSRANPLMILPISQKNIAFTVPSCNSSLTRGVGRDGRGALLNVHPNSNTGNHLTVNSVSPKPQRRRFSDVGCLSSLGAQQSIARNVAEQFCHLSVSPKHRSSFSSIYTGNQASVSTPSSPYRVTTSTPKCLGTLGTLDPSLYTDCGEIGRHSADNEEYDIHYNPPPGHLGRVWFSLEYESETEKLLVTLVRAKHLPCRSRAHANSCDPFARIYLMPDERRYLQSKPRKKTCDPKFGESYVFQVSARNLYERTLKISIYDIDRQRRHHVIGHAICCFRDLQGDTTDILSYERLTLWRDLEREVVEPSSDRGELQTSLSYNSTLERLTIGILHGRHFKNLCSSSSGNQDYYVKLCLCQNSRPLKTKRTALVRGSSDAPHFNESFTFKLATDSLDTYSINAIIMQYKAGLKDKQLGRVVIGSFMFARGRERDHWNSAIGTPGEQFLYWHTLS